MSITPSKRILSGVQPTGNLHLGNYLGAIRNWVRMQDTHECLFMLADLHAITVPQDPAELVRHTRETAAAYIACGVDPEKSAIFPQSAVPAHAELTWILSCHTPLGWLNRMTQFKEKARLATADDKAGQLYSLGVILSPVQHALKSMLGMENLEGIKSIIAEVLETTKKNVKDEVTRSTQASSVFDSANLGLYSYPVLMAADIIVYKATHVPVGEDQKQHLELSRDIAGAFNRHYNREYFPLPEPVIVGEATRVMSLRDGTKKMSKSDESDYSRIHLTDDAETIEKKIKKAKSDMEPGISSDHEKRPESANLLSLYAALKGISLEAAEAECAGDNFSTFKKKLAEVAVEHLRPISTRMRELLSAPDELDSILKRGIEKARSLADVHMREVKEIVGFWH